MPFDTDTMIFDTVTKQYILTDEALRRNGIFLRERLALTRCPQPETVINSILQDISDMVYEYVHKNSVHNDSQDYIIANCMDARQIIERAMLKQANYVIANGNLNLAVDEHIRNKAMSPEAEAILNKTIREIGSSILYTGV